MMVSAMRPTIRSVQPPKYPAATPRARHEEHSATEADSDEQVEPGRNDHAAEHVAAS